MRSSTSKGSDGSTVKETTTSDGEGNKVTKRSVTSSDGDEKTVYSAQSSDGQSFEYETSSAVTDPSGTENWWSRLWSW
ncbi:hypothetical protein GCM10023201_47270 [Actinomycetospora corticicola]